MIKKVANFVLMLLITLIYSNLSMFILDVQAHVALVIIVPFAILHLWTSNGQYIIARSWLFIAAFAISKFIGEYASLVVIADILMIFILLENKPEERRWS